MTVTFGEYRLVRYDSRNWVLQRYREPAPDSRLIADDADVDLPGAIRRAEEIARGLRESARSAGGPCATTASNWANQFCDA